MSEEFRKKFLKSDRFAVEVYQKYMNQPCVVRSIVAAMQSILDAKCKDKLCEIEKALESLEGFQETRYSPHENESLVYKLRAYPLPMGKGFPRRKMIISYGEGKYPLDRSKLKDQS